MPMLSFTQQTDNHGIHAVPAPAGVTMDGRLGDWDLSGHVLMCYDLEPLRDACSAETAMMFDAENLCVAVHWKDAAHASLICQEMIAEVPLTGLSLRNHDS